MAAGKAQNKSARGHADDASEKLANFSVDGDWLGSFALDENEVKR